MKFVVKGKFKSLDDLPNAELPANAKCYEEPDDLDEITMQAMKYGFMALGIAIAAYLGKYFGAGFDNIHILPLILGIPASYLMIIPHEILHGICYPRGAIVEIWSAIDHGMFFVTSGYPISKARFIWMSLFPSILFGLIPLIIVIFMPVSWWEDFLFSFAASNLVHGAGDYLNVVNTFKQVPKKAKVANSGIHTYWWEEKDVPDSK